MEMKYIKDAENNIILPVTSSDAVKDSYGTSVTTHIINLQNADSRLLRLYESLTEGDLVVLQSNEWPILQGTARTIYRVAGTTSYSDYMFDSSDLTTPILMATYENIIDEEPTINSQNLVKSNGVAKAVEGIEHVISSEEGIDNIKIEDGIGNVVAEINSEYSKFHNLKNNNKDIQNKITPGTGLSFDNDILNVNVDDNTINNSPNLKNRLDSTDSDIKQLTDKTKNIIVSSNENKDNLESLKLVSNDETECYVEMNSDGVYGKAVKYKDGDKIFDVKEEINNLKTKCDSSIANDALLDRKNLESDLPYWINSPSTIESYDDYGYLDNKIKSVPDGRHFLFVTDTHWDYSSRKSNYLMNYVKKRLGIKKVIFGGDAIGANNTKYEAANVLSKYADQFFSAFGKDAIWCQGNHDGNWVAVSSSIHATPEVALIDDSEIYNRTVARIADKVHFDEEAITLVDSLPYNNETKEEIRYFLKYSYYVDDDVDKIRYIVIDTGIGSKIQYELTHSAYGSSMPIFYKTLIRFLSSTPADYDVVVAGHMIAYYDVCFEQIMSAFKVGASSVTFNKNWEWYSVFGNRIFICEEDAEYLRSNLSEYFVKEKYKVYDHYIKVGNTWSKSGTFLAEQLADVTELNTTYPNPVAGQYTYVGNDNNGWTKYECLNNGTWSATAETVNSWNIVYKNPSIWLSTFLGTDASQVTLNTGFTSPFNKKIFSISGHWHIDAATYSMSANDVTTSVVATGYTDNNNYIDSPELTNDAVLNIICDTDSYNLVDTQQMENTYGVKSSAYTHTGGTTTESSFNIITIGENEIYITNFGSGEDRSFNI